MKHVRICGVMGMASYTEDEQRIRNEFRTLYEYFTNLKQGYFSGKTYFREISMGSPVITGSPSKKEVPWYGSAALFSGTDLFTLRVLATKLFFTISPLKLNLT